MDWVIILTVVAAVVGVIAGVVQVVQYFQDRKKKTLEKEVLTQTPVNLPSVEQSIAARTESFGSEAGKKPLVLHNLPNTDYGQFIGREIETTKIHNILRPYPNSQHSIVTIDGIGGIGKSALALEVAHYYLRNYSQIQESERFEAIIWVSAKRTVLTADGIKPRPQTLNTLDDIYSAISITLGREDITRARLEEQLEIVRQALIKQRTLLIVDNLETVDDESVLLFLRELPAPTKCIVTTRHRIDVAYPVRLVGMPWHDAERLILNECERKDVQLDSDQVHSFFQRTGGVPLALVWSIAQVGMGHSPENVLNKLGDPISNISKYCFDEVVGNIRNKNSYTILVAISLFESDASRTSLQYVAELPELECDDGLAALERLSLVNKTNDRFSL